MRRSSLMWPGVAAIAATIALGGCATRQTAAGAPQPPSPGASGGAAAGGESGTGSTSAAGSEDAKGGAQTPDEKRDALDRNLQGSLSEFDAMLLKEQQEVAAKRAEHGTGGPAGGASGAGEGGEGEGEGQGGGASGGGAAGGARGSGSKGGGAQAGGTETGGSQTSGNRTGTTQDREGGRGGSGSRDRATGSSQSGGGGRGGRETTSAPEGTPPGDGDSDRVPEDVGDGRDDDIVARQLREAAMAEEDPAIREKLWEEYRRYKRGGSGGGGR